MKKQNVKQNRPPTLAKAPTGIQGLDELTGGGLPQGRPTLLCGGAGSGKTLVGMEFLVRGATEFGEPGVFMSFEENARELAQNFASLGHNLNTLVAQKNWRWTSFTSSAPKSRRPASMIWKACSSGWGTRLKASVPGGWCSTPLRRCSPG